jgi:acid phosphatase
MEPFLKKLNTSRQHHNVSWTSAPSLSFLSNWKSPVSEAESEMLTKVGQLEAFQLGLNVENRYQDFRQPAKVWTSTAERTVRSATSFIDGLVTNANGTKLIQVSEEEEEGATSLTPHESCPAYSSSRGSKQSEVSYAANLSRSALQLISSKVFLDIYTKPILSRFRAEVPYFNWTADDIVGMQEMCGYETVIRGSSPFCSLSLFTPDEWLGFEYMNDIMYHHNTGYGNPISGVLGWPWVNTTSQLLLSNATSNSTQDLYVSFTHRELPPTVLVALGLFNNSAFSGANNVNATMPSNMMNPARLWQSSRILPFLTNVAIEKMECDSYSFQDNASTTGEYYRVLVNRSPQLLPNCVDGPGYSCSRSGWENLLEERGNMFGGFSEKCGVDYKNSTDVLSIYH